MSFQLQIAELELTLAEDMLATLRAGQLQDLENKLKDAIEARKSRIAVIQQNEGAI